MKLTRLLGLALACNLLAAPAHAALMKGYFEGVIYDSGTSADGVNFDVGIADGMTVRGTFNFDSTRAPAPTPAANGTWYNYVDFSQSWFDVVVSVPGLGWSRNLEPTLEVANDPEYYDGTVIDDLPGADFMQVYAERYSTEFDGGGNVTDFTQYFLDLEFGSSVTDFLDGGLGVEQNFDISVADMDTFAGGQLDYTVSVGQNFESTYVVFDLTRVRLSRNVSEPSMPILMAIGLAGMIAGLRRTRANA